MKLTDDYLPQTLGNSWQFLGEVELRIDSDVEDALNTRLLGILTPLNLQEDFLHKILQSAQDATLRARKSEGVKTEFEYIHLVVFAQNRQVAGQQTWGFFRFERGKSTFKNLHHSVHSVELYLYLEGS